MTSRSLPRTRPARGLARRAAAAMLAAALVAPAAGARPVRADHPLLGTWQLQVPGSDCVETYMFRRDGTTLVTSAAEVSQSEFEVADTPTADGFYKWTDKLVKDNGKQDCSGNVMQLGKPVTNYVLFNDAQDQFLMCASANIRTCIGPALRVEANDI